MKLFITTISLIVSLWNINVESPRNKHIPTNAESKKNQSKNFNGLWININEKTRGLTKCKIIYESNSFTVQMWGSCHPQDCNWGENIARDIKKTDKFELLWDQKFAESNITYELIDEKLKITNKRHYKDNSGRLDNTTVEYFQKE